LVSSEAGGSANAAAVAIEGGKQAPLRLSAMERMSGSIMFKSQCAAPLNVLWTLTSEVHELSFGQMVELSALPK
jgi:hypothetical protein